MRIKNIYKRILSALLAVLMMIPANGISAMAAPKSGSKSTEAVSSNGFEIHAEWADTEFKNGNEYNLYEDMNTSNAVRLRISYRNNQVSEKGYAAGQLNIVVKGIGAVMRKEKLEAAVGADRDSSSVKDRDWSYTWNKANDTYLFTNNKAVEPNSVLSGYFDMVWEILARDSVDGFLAENITAELLISDGTSALSESLTFTNDTKCDEYEVDIELGTMYGYEGLTDGISNPDEYAFVKYIFESDERRNSRTTKDYRFIFDPDTEGVGSGAIVIPTETPMKDNGDGTYIASMLKQTYTDEDEYVYVAYPRSEYTGKTVNASLSLYGTYYEGDDSGNVGELLLADDMAEVFISPDFDFSDIPGDVYQYWKDTYYDKYVKAEVIQERGGDVQGIKMRRGTEETFYLEGFFNYPWDLVEQKKEDDASKTDEEIDLVETEGTLSGNSISVEETQIDMGDGLESDAGIETVADILHEDALFSLEFVDDFIYITENNGNYRQLEAGEYEFTELTIPSSNSLKNINNISLKSGVYPVKVWSYQNGAVVGEDNGTLEYDGTLLSSSKKVKLSPGTTAVRILIEELDVSIKGYSIPIKVKFHTDENKDDNLTTGQAVNTTFIRIYQNGEWIFDDFTEDNYQDETNLNLAQKDLDIYGSYLDRERDNITFYVAEKSNYSSNTGISKIKKNGYSYLADFTMGGSFNYKEEETPDKFSIYTILPDYMDIYGYDIEEDVWDLFSYSGFGLSSDVIAEHCNIEIDENYKGSGRTYVAAHFDFTDMEVSQQDQIVVSFKIKIDRKILRNVSTIFVRSAVQPDEEVNSSQIRKVKDNGNWGEGKLFSDIDNDKITDELMAVSSDYTTYTYVDSSQLEMSKSVKTDTVDEYVQLPDVPLAEADSIYSYELSIRNGESMSKDIIVRDILETGANAEWQGTFESFDISDAKREGLDGTIYYSTKATPDESLESSDWTTECPVDKGKVKAVAVNLDSGQLKAGGEINLYIHMKAPSDNSLRGKKTENEFSAAFTMMDKSGVETESDSLDSNPVQVELTSELKNLIVTKVDKEDASKLKGAKFALLRKDTEELVAEGVTNIRGQLIFKDLCLDEVYILREVEAPKGYEFVEDVEVVLDSDNKNTYITVEDTRKTGSAEIYKINYFNNFIKVQGAEYTLYTSDGEELSVAVTDINGRARFEDLAWGDYYIKETESPAGYVLDEESYSFTVNRENVEVVNRFTIKEKQDGAGKVRLVKYEMSTTGVQTQNPIAGAIFRLVDITSSTESVVGTYVTDSNGEILLEDLAYGDYKFTETRIPLGYEKVDDVTFEITPDAKEKELFVYNKRKSGSINIYKHDNLGNIVEGAVFELYDETKNNVLGTYTTDNNGNIFIIGMEWGTYYLKEKSVPECYQLSDEWIEVIISKNSLTKDLDIENETKKGSIVLVKTNEIGNPIVPEAKEDRATFTLYHENGSIVSLTDQNGVAVLQENLVQNDEGKIIVEGLEWGKYYFKETKAPAGYSMTDEAIRFSVNSINAGIEQEIDVVNPLNEKKISLTKKIFADDINFDNGDPTFLFKVTGTDIYGKEHTYHRIMRFDSAYVEAKVDEEGYVSQSVTVSGLVSGTYTASEEESSRYALSYAEGVGENTEVVGDTVVINIGSAEFDDGGALFVNAKYEHGDFSDNQSLANIIKKQKRMTSLKATWIGDETVVAGAQIDKKLVKVLALYDDGTTKELDETEWSFDSSFSGSSFPNINGDYYIPVTYTENGITKTGSFEVKIYGAFKEKILRIEAAVKEEYEDVIANTELNESMFVVTAVYNDSSKELLGENDYIVVPRTVPGTIGMFEVKIVLDMYGYKDNIYTTVNLNSIYPDPVLMDGNSFNSKIPSHVTDIVFTDLMAPDVLEDGTEVFVMDVSDKQDGTAVSWVDGTTMYVSSQRRGKHVIANVDSLELFKDKNNLKSIDLSGLDTSQVTDMSYMFDGCRNLKSLNVSSFDTSNVTNMSYMFNGCRELESIDLSSFDTSNVTDMFHMFSGCERFTSLDVSSFDTSNVTNMSYMFGGCSRVTSLDLSNFDTSNVTNMNYMFGGCSRVTSLDLSNFDTSNVTDMGYMFISMLFVNSLDLSSFDTSNVTDMSSMFAVCYGLDNLDLSSFDTSNVTNMSGMFSSATALTSLDLSSFDTSKVTSMSAMFCDTRSLTSLDLSNFDTSKVTNMYEMFGRSSLTSLDLSSFDTSKVTNMDGMFDSCSSLTSLDLSNFDTSNVRNMSSMFSNASSLTSLDLSSFDTSKVTNMSSMFSNASSLTSLDLSSFDTSKVTSMSSMFGGCINVIDGQAFARCKTEADKLNEQLEKDGITSWEFNTVAPVIELNVVIGDEWKDSVSCEVPEIVEGGITELRLTSIVDNLIVISFKANGVQYEGNSFVAPEESGTVTITDVEMMSCVIIESEHNPYPGNMNTTNADGTVGKIYGEATFDGAVFLNVVLDYQTQNELYDWIYLYDADGNIVNGKKYGGSTRTQETISVPGDYVKIVFRTNASYNDYYGFKATVTPVYPIELTVDNQCDDLVTVDVPEKVAPSITEISLHPISDNSGIVSFKLNGEEIIGNTFTAPAESGTVTITDIEMLNVVTPDNVETDVPDCVELGTTVLTLTSTIENREIASFKVNGTEMVGNSFVITEELGSDIVISDVVLLQSTTIESEHNPYPNNMNETNADGTEGKIYGEATFDGAVSLNVALDYQTENTFYDWIYLYDADGNIVNNKKYGGSTRTQETISVPGDYVKIVFRTDSSSNNYYGFKATVTPVYIPEVELEIVNQCPELVTVDKPDVVYSGLTEIELIPVADNSGVLSFKLNGERVFGNSFTAPTESGTVTISQVRLLNIVTPENVEADVPDCIEVGSSEIRLSATEDNKYVTSFKLNGTKIVGESFLVTEEHDRYVALGSDIVISDVKFNNQMIVESEHYPYPYLPDGKFYEEIYFEGAVSLIVLLDYEIDSNYDRLVMFYEGGNRYFYGERTQETITVPGNYVQFDFGTNNTDNNYYGFKATVRPVYPPEIELDIDNQCSDLVTVNKPDTVYSELTEIELIPVADNSGVLSFKLNGETIVGNRFTAPKESGTVTITDVEMLNVVTPDNVEVDVPDCIELGTTVLTLTPTMENRAIASFKVNGTEVVGNSFVITEALGSDIVISDVVEQIIIESEHNPYPNSMYTTNADGTVGKIYGEATFEGAAALTVVLDYQTESASYDWIYLYDEDGNIVNDKKYGGSTRTQETIAVPGDYVKIVFRTDNSGNDFYGFNAVVTPVYPIDLAVDNQCSDLVTVDVPEKVAPNISEITLHPISDNSGIVSFKLNGEEITGNTFTAPAESGTVTISDVVMLNLTYPETVTTDVPDGIEVGKTELKLTSSVNNMAISSFKVNGTEVSGSSFVITAAMGNQIAITDVVLFEGKIIESEHNPYPNNMSTSNADGTVGKVYGDATFEGAAALTVVLDYQTQNTLYDWIYLYDEDGNIVNNKKYGGYTRTQETIIVPGDYVKVLFRTDGSVNTYYGFKATITPVYPIDLAVDNQCSDLVTVDVPEKVVPNISEITLHPISDNSRIVSFKLNGEEITGNTFTAPAESGTVTISDVVILNFTYPETVTIDIPDVIEVGATELTLIPIKENALISSFKVNETEVLGDSFVITEDMGSNIVISDVVINLLKIIESEHNPYPNNMKTSNADGTVGKVYGDVTFEDAVALNVELDYQTESTSYDWIYLYDADGNIVNNKKYGGSTRTKENIIVNGDYVKVLFRTDSSGNNYYGFKATITPVYPIDLTVDNQCADLVTVDVPETVLSNTSEIKLNTLDDNTIVSSFKVNGTEVVGDSFVYMEDMGTDIVITDVVVSEGKIIESEHNPYPNNMSTSNADGTQGKIYGDVTFEDAVALNVELDYQTQSTSYDWIYLYDADGNIVNNKKYGGTTRKTETIIVNGNYVKVLFRTNGSDNSYYGFKATITPVYPIDLIVDNQCDELVTVDVPERVAPNISEITLHPISDNSGIVSFKLNGEEISGNTFTAPAESGTVTISDVVMMNFTYPETVTVDVPDVIEIGKTELKLISSVNNMEISSFKVNGTEVSGSSFVITAAMGNQIAITDVVLFEGKIIESEHKPYPNNMNQTNADGTVGKVYGEVAFDGAEALNVVLDYQTEDKSYDWIYLYDADGNIVNDKKYGGYTRTVENIIVTGGYVKVVFCTDAVGNNYYGFKATITPVDLNISIGDEWKDSVKYNVSSIAEDGTAEIQIVPFNPRHQVTSFKANGIQYTGNTITISGSDEMIVITDVLTEERIVSHVIESDHYPYNSFMTGSAGEVTFAGAVSLNVVLEYQIGNDYLYMFDSNGYVPFDVSGTGSEFKTETITIPGNYVNIYFDTFDYIDSYYGFKATITPVYE